MQEKKMTFEEFIAQYPNEQCLTCGNQDPQCPDCAGCGFWLYEDDEFRTKDEMHRFWSGEWVSAA
jgi:hypothetical protein